MTKSDIIESGLRLIGFWLLITASISLISSATLGTLAYRSLKKDPNVTELRLFGVTTQTNSGSTSAAMSQSARNTMQLWTAQSTFYTSFIKFLFALYLCKGGRKIIEFLSGEDKEAQHGPPDGRVEAPRR